VTDFKKLGKSIQKNKPDVIIHLAGQTSHLQSFENPLKDIDSNAKSTLFILEEIRKKKLKCRFILGSTFVVIGRPQKLPVDERTPSWPTMIYGANRLASEHYCKIYHEVYGLDTLTFRITNSFGPREQVASTKNAVNFLIHEAFLGKTVTIFKKGNFFRDIIYVSDVISGIKTIMKKGKSGELYWISSGKKIWFYELGKSLKKLTNAKVKFVKEPNYTKKVDVGNFVVDNSKLRALGWKPKINLNQGIKETLEYFKSEKIN
jgi:UDP-glucose 4-epimerase